MRKWWKRGCKLPLLIRQARTDEFPYLAEQLGPTAELVEGRCWVADLNGELVGVLPLRQVWNAEPLMLLPTKNKLPKITKSRTMLLLYVACEDFIRDTTRNKLGPRFLMVFTRSKAVSLWSYRLGWLRCFKGSAIYIKHFPKF